MQSVLEKIYKSGLKLLVLLTLQETYATAVNEAVKLVDGADGTISLADQNTHRLKAVYHTYPEKYILKIRRKGFTYRSFRNRQAFVANTDRLKRVHSELIPLGVKSMIFIPLSYRNKAIGVLSIRSNKENYFKDKDLDTLKLFGSMVSLAITKAQLYDQTQNLVKAQDLFLSIAAHEFRTPLTTINGYAQLLQSKATSEGTSEHRWLKELNFECTRLSKLVNELLDISRIKSNRFHYDLRHIEIQEIVQKAIIAFNFNHPESKLKFTNHLKGKLAFVIGDSNKLIQVITNVLDNATKFSPIQSHINISLKSKPPYIVLEIKDQGHGISSADLPKVFEDFYRGHSTSTSGLGIGLFLCKSIIDHHHGIIDIRSKPSKGTSVVVKLPQAKI